MGTVAELPRGPRHPDGVVVDPEPALPRAAESALASGVVSLKEPLDARIVKAAVDAFFAVFTRHDPDALDGILSRSARLLDSHGASSYAVVRDELLRRVAAFKASNVTAIRADVVDRSGFRDLGQSGVRPRPDEMRPGDILVRVEVTVPRVSGDRLFGDRVMLLLRWEEDADAPGPARLRVAGFDEEDVR